MPMAKVHKAKNRRRRYDDLTVSHRERLVEELRADPRLAAEYLSAAAEDDDRRVSPVALRTVARR